MEDLKNRGHLGSAMNLYVFGGSALNLTFGKSDALFI